MDDLAKALDSRTVTTPGGILVSEDDYHTLVKSQQGEQDRAPAKGAEAKRGSLFSSFLFQNMSAYGAREKPIGTPSFDLLYRAARASFVDAILIRARIDQQKRIWNHTFSKGTLGFRVVHDRDDDPDFKTTKRIEERCREMEEIIKDPTPVKYREFYPHSTRPHDGIKSLISILTRAELVIDRKVIRRIPSRDGGIAAFHYLPGATIKTVDEALREWTRKNTKKGTTIRQAAAMMSEATQFDIETSAYVQIIDGIIINAFTEDEVCVHISCPSDEVNRFGYGESRLETSLDITATLMHAWNFNKEMFRTNYPEAILTVAGDYDKPGLEAFKRDLLGQTTGTGNYWRLPVIPAGQMDSFKVEMHKLRETPKDMLFDQFIRMLVMFKAAAYGAHPTVLNLQPDSGGGSSLFGHNPTDEIEFSKEHGLIPSIQDMCDWLTDSIIKPKYDDLKLIITGLEKEDEKVATDIRTSRASKWMTKNEARLEEGLPPRGFWVEPEKYEGLSDEEKQKFEQNPYNHPADVAVVNYINTFNGMQQDDEGGDDQGGDGQDDPWNDKQAQDYYGRGGEPQQDEPLGKSMPKRSSRLLDRTTRYMKIRLED